MFNRRSRVQTYSMVIGVVIGMFVAGVAVPLIVAHPASTIVSNNGTRFGAGVGAAGESAGDVNGELATATTIAGDIAASGAVGSTGGTGVGGVHTSGGGTTGSNGTPAKVKGPPIKIGITILNLANATALGFPGGASPADQEAVWSYWADQYNKAGGANGRPLEVHFATYDPIQESSMRDACLELTEHQHVFLGVASGGFVGPPLLCFTEEHNTPLLAAGSSGVPQEFFPRSRGLLLTAFQGSDRTVKNFVAELDALKVLKGKKVGIMFDLRSGPASIADQLESTLKAAGYNVAHKSVYSADYQTAASQVPVEVQQMEANGVNAIVNMAHTLILTQFTQNATGQGYTPPYYNSDWNGANSDFYYSNMPSSYDGNINFTITRSGEFRVNAPEPALDKQCREEASKALGKTVPRDDTTNGAYARDCAFFELLTRGLVAAGSNLTGAGFTNALRGLGSMEVAGFGGFNFGPTPDGAELIRTSVWHANCKCVEPVTPFRRLKY
jgi:ABC-type branched-subunit amino acid transport system substrate-binding protein